ncbi:hypothetical protein OUO20_02180 [Arthrobacter sp. FX8]|uniref:hypothetical protein n=1 Tax=Arthrobacter sp. FX8 TaxID=2997335 RepID=UPI00227C83FE|nr:hypothetical protein [Arthrobacter sp. FX8]WAJ33850.1 hypothetical protein OUO20_02180 [Arthrobacter sp. FX8]
MVSGATCSGSPVGVGSAVGGGLAGADDGGAAADVVGAAEVLGGVVGVADAVGLAVVLGDAPLGLALLAVGLGTGELLEGAGAGGPKHPVRSSRLLNPRMLSAEGLGLVMTPP